MPIDCTNGCIAKNGSWVPITGEPTPNNYEAPTVWYSNHNMNWIATGALLLPLATFALCCGGYLLKTVIHNRKKDLAFISDLYHKARFGSIVVDQPQEIRLRTFKPQLSIIIEEHEPREEPNDIEPSEAIEETDSACHLIH